MKIVVNHLTRMEPGYICVAGLNLESRKHIRPVLRGKRLESRLLASRGGPFEMGTVVNLGFTWPCGTPPAVEDVAFLPGLTRRADRIGPQEFWELLAANARASLRDIFGEGLHSEGRTCVTDLNTGSASLGCLRLSNRPRLEVDQQGRIRMVFSDGALSCSCSVTDIRLYESDQKTVRKPLVERISAGLGATSVIVGVGLTRPYMRPGDSIARHWLQVNGIFLQSDPLLSDSGIRN